MGSTPPSSLVFAFGRGDYGQLGQGSGEADSLSQPTLVDALSGVSVRSISCGSAHVPLPPPGGEVYTWGKNEHSQLGRQRRHGLPSKVEALASLVLKQVSCGQDHTTVLSSSGEVYTFGRNNFAQLGLVREEAVRSKPYHVRALADKHIVRVACGGNHTLALGDNGVVWSWGCGLHGQLGRREKVVSHSPLPLLLGALPVMAIACGYNFSALLTISGSVYTFGTNTHGELGHNDTNQRVLPELVTALKGKRIVAISCGKSHMLALSADGELWGWGQAERGQLGAWAGHPSSSSPVLSPRLLPSAHGLEVIHISCGDYHSLFVAQAARNSSSAGEELATDTLSTDTIGRVEQVYCLGSRQEIRPAIPYLNGVAHSHWTVAAGGDFSLLLAQASPSSDSASSLSELASSPARWEVVAPLTTVDTRELSKRISEGAHPKLYRYLDSIIAWPASLNASFLSESHFLTATGSTSGLDYTRIHAFFQLLRHPSLKDSQVMDALHRAYFRALSKCVPSQPPSLNPELLRLFCILFEDHSLRQVTRFNLSLIESAVRCVRALHSSQYAVLLAWWGHLPSQHFTHIITSLQSFLQYVSSQGLDERVGIMITNLLSDLYGLNVERAIVPYDYFYIDSLLPTASLESELQRWLLAPSEAVFTYLNYPFFLPPALKTSLLRLSAQRRQTAQMMTAPFAPFFVLTVRREHLLEDTISQLARASPQGLKRPLKVVFEGEQGIDEGGVQKEFFQLAVEALFDPNFGLFQLEKQTNLWWFHPAAKGETNSFLIFGILFGLALYNSVLIPVAFPQLLFKKLLKSCPGASYARRHEYVLGLADVQETFPTIGKNLKFLLEFEGDVSAFEQMFETSYDNYGRMETVELIPGGSHEPVTNANRDSFVAKYVEYLVTTSVAPQFEAFRRGFMMVSGGPVLDLFNAEELSLSLVGMKNSIDTSKLEAVAKYEGFDATDSVVRDFWSLVHQWPQSLKKQMLLFITGTDRLPVGGISTLRFVLQRNGPDSDLLPTASTCYNTLLLPAYTSREKLEAKLKLAFQFYRGFGLK
eukprot:TRINITY_DN5371_c0_g1_i1.p1 TRINITY_DN5371_c0_g1~~TRINITY_DN5371_c0_g1_i1.p1  ORF type:complete len:1070 (-),score=118.80 TRINITY_DN5371_c0_g1_i1:77-3217(-)